MERSWWIVLILICNMSYGQVSSGAIANNRFLQRTNPQIDRAIADGGSSLDHAEIQKLARQMVDLGIWGNLNLWLHGGLIRDTIVSGVDRINKSYDISGNNKDFIEWPHIANSFPFYDTLNSASIFKFIGWTSPKLLAVTSTTISNAGNYTIIAWVKPKSTDNSQSAFFSVKGVSFWSLQFSIGAFAFVANNVARSILTPDRVINDWNMYAVTRNGDNYTLILYNINGNYTYTATFTGSYRGDVTSYIGLRINDNSNTSIANAFNGNISEIRTFNIALTASQIDAIFQETRGKYGI